MPTINGTNQSDTLIGSIDADLINAGNGNDVVDGGMGNDTISGGNGNDALAGGLGDDILLGDNGNDILDGGAGSDTVNAGNGDDVVVHVASQNAGSLDVYEGGSGRDTLRLVLPSTMHGSAAFQVDLAAFQVKLLQGSASHFFASLNIQVSSFERLEIVIDNGANQAPTDIALTNATMAENSAAGTVVGALSAIDPDAGDSKTFTLLNNAGGLFAISGGNLVVAGGLDHETAPSHQVTVRVTDSAGNFYDETITIGVTNVNEAPTAISLNNVSVAENAAGATIGLLSTVDPDAGNTHTYSVNDTRFEVVDGALRLKTGVSLNHEAEPTINVGVTSTDPSNLSHTQSFTIVVANVNEAPTAIALNNATVNEASAGAAVGMVTIVDPDAFDTAILSVDDERFEIVDGVLKLRTGVTLDFEQEGVIDVTVSATDAGGLPLNQTFTISVNDGVEGTGCDGYIAGATVFADTNENGTLDPGEATTTTDANGMFTLFGGVGPLVMYGGTDIATGQLFTGIMRAPEGSTVVTPLTTLVASLVADPTTNTTIAEANSQVLAALGLSSTFDLSSFDPIAATLSSNPATQAAGVAVFAAAIQVQNTISQATAVLDGAGALDIGAAIAAVVDALASEMAAQAAANTIINLGDATLIASVITDSGAAVAGVDTATVALVADQAASIITATNDLVEASASDPNVTGIGLLKALAQVAAVAQGDASLSIVAATADAASTGTADAINTSVTYFTGGALDTAVAAIVVENVEGANVGETINGTTGADTLFGYGGNDTLNGFAGDDILNGGDGDDTLNGGIGLNTLIGGAGNDTLNGKELVYGPNNRDSDKADYSGATGAINVVLSANSSVIGDASVGTDSLNRINWVVGTSYDDTYVATSSVLNQFGTFNEFEGGGGDDTITGNGGTRIGYRTATDAVTVDFQGGAGFGTGQTTSGADANVGIDHFTGVNSVSGSAFGDTLLGSDASTFEQFRGHAGNDTIDGRGGTQDLADYRNSTNGIVAVLGVGGVIGTGTVLDGFVQNGVASTDTLYHIEQIRGSEFADQITGDAGNNVLQGMYGADILDGGAGFDTLSYSGPSITGIGVDVNLLTGAASGGDAAGDMFSNFENITGSRYADVLAGDNAGNRLDGQLGDDTLFGLGGDDTLIGGDGDDSLDGGSGFNQFFGGAGDDTLIGGNAVGALDGNRADYSGASGPITVSMGTTSTVSGNASVGLDTLQNIDGVFGTSSADTFTVTTALSNQFGNFVEFEGGGGDDTINGNGNTRISYRSANEAVTVDLFLGTGKTTSGNPSNVGVDNFTGVNQIRGSNHADTLLGTDGGGFESFRGQAGNDFIDGRGGTQDRADYNNSNFGITANLNTGQIQDGFGSTDTLQNIEFVRGSRFNDAIVGNSVNNRLEGEAGDDTLIGGAGNDDVRGGLGTGDTAVYSGLRAQYTVTADVNGTIITVAHTGGTQADGTDTVQTVENFRFADGIWTTANLLSGGAPWDVPASDIQISGTTIQENAPGGAVVGVLAVTDPDSGNLATFSLLDDAGGRFQIFNGGQFGWQIVVAPGAILDYETATSHSVTVRATDSVGATYDEVITINVSDVAGLTIIGDNGNNTLTGTSEEDLIQGLAGNDLLIGGDGDDVLDGGVGFNTYVGGAGDDTLIGGNSPDAPNSDSDRADYSSATGSITAILSDTSTVTGNASVGTDTLQRINWVVGSQFADTLTATNLVSNQFGTFNEFEGGGGDDQITGNGNTRIGFRTAQAGVTVDLEAGTSLSTVAGDVASVGLDHFAGVTQVRGSTFDDTLLGSNSTGFESFRAERGNDFIDGRDGTQDRADYRNSPDAIIATLGVGNIIGTGTVHDGFGTMDTLANIEQIRGSDFADQITGDAGNNYIDGGAGDDILDGGAGFDALSYQGSSGGAGVNVNLLLGTATGGDATGDVFLSFENLFGSRYDDNLTGDDSNNQMRGEAGNDTLSGLAGNDSLDGGAGDDTLIGGDGRDFFTGGSGDDFIGGGTNPNGNGDAVSYGTSTQSVDVNLATGIAFDGLGGNDTLVSIEAVFGSSFGDTLTGSTAGNEVFEGRGGGDIINGGGNSGLPFGDFAQYLSASNTGVIVNLASGTAIDGQGGTDTLINIDSINASNFNDTVIGNANANFLRGFSGADTMYGGDGDDQLEGDQLSDLSSTGDDALYGEGGSDTIKGNNGNDLLSGGAGNDFLDGQADTDTAVFTGNRADYIITGTTGAMVIMDNLAGRDGTDTVNNVEFVQFADGTFAVADLFAINGNEFNNYLVGTTGNDVINGLGGDDTIAGLAGNDTINGGSNGPFVDNVDYSISPAGINVNLLTGIAQDGFGNTDQLSGIEGVIDSAFADTIVGDDNINWVRLGNGTDTVDAGGGADVVFYESAPSGVTINLNMGSAIDGFGNTDTILNFENAHGSFFNDSVTLTDGNGYAFGRAGNDSLYGLGGNDTLIAGSGNDLIDGGSGIDTARYVDDGFDGAGVSTQGVVVNLATGTATDNWGGADTLVSIENVQGSSLNDTIVGNAGDNFLDGGAGDDVISGGSGFNTYVGGAGNDTLVGGNAIGALDGNRADYSGATGPITVSMGATSIVSGNTTVGTDTLQNIDSIVGTSAGDTFTATSQLSNQFGNFVEFEGGGGNDTITGNGNTRVSYRNASEGVTVDLVAGTGHTTSNAVVNVGVDTFVSGVNQIRGSAFGDTLLGTDGGGFESFRGQAGDDFIDGRGGLQDRADYSNSTFGINANLLTGQVHDGFGYIDTVQNIEQIRGSEAVDWISGNAGSNRLEGRGGNDTVYGLAGDDTLDGGNGDDFLDGGIGFNTLIGGAGNDTLTGSGLGGRLDFNTADYGAATTGITAVLSAASTVTGDASVGTDTLVFIDRVLGSIHADSFTADTTLVNQFGLINEFEGRGGNDTIVGNGSTRISYAGANAAVTVDLAMGTGQFTSQVNGIIDNVGLDSFSGVSQIRGSAHADTLLGSNTTLLTEVFRGQAGNDLIDGRGGQDRVDYNGSASVTVTLGEGAAAGTASDGFGGTDTLYNIEQIRGSQFTDSLTGNSDDNRFIGLAGADTINGMGGIDWVDYNNESDQAGIVADLGTGSVQDGYGFVDALSNIENIRGTVFADTITGDSDVNVLEGQAGNDTLRGGAGNDTLTGGAGVDTFVFATGDGADMLVDFSGGDGDVIDLTGVGLTDFTQLQSQMDQVDGNVIIDLGNGDSITIQNFLLGSIQSQMFVI